MSFSRQYKKLKKQYAELSEKNEEEIKELNNECTILQNEIDEYTAIIQEKTHIISTKKNLINEKEDELIIMQNRSEMFRHKHFIFCKDFQPLGFYEDIFQIIFDYSLTLRLHVVYDHRSVMDIEIYHDSDIIRESDTFIKENYGYIFHLESSYGCDDFSSINQLKSKTYKFTEETNIVHLIKIFGKKFNLFNIDCYDQFYVYDFRQYFDDLNS